MASNPEANHFKIAHAAIRPIATGHGACIASNLITRKGQKVASMYREAPDRSGDSGWRFKSGLESDQDLEDPDGFGIYDVNTIANYDPEIIPYLSAAAESAFEREGGVGPFAAVNFDPPAE